MAKGSAMGLWKGKKGSSVFYKITNSNSEQKQGIRERVYEVANPQTTSQASQRLKLLPAQRVAGAIREIVERGWQGTKYGAQSKGRFLSQALQMKSGFPFVEKGDDRTIPGRYQITKGTLQPVSVRFDDFDMMISDLSLNDNQRPTTVGQLSSMLLEGNPQLRDGDQITFVYCFTNAQVGDLVNAQFTWGYYSFYIDTTSAADMGTLSSPTVTIGAAEIVPEDDELALALSVNSGAVALVAGACIVSRLSDTGTYMRSSATLLVVDRIDEAFMSSAAEARAIESYKSNTSTTSTNWPVDPEEPPRQVERSAFILRGLTGIYAAANGKSCMVSRYVDDNSLEAVYVKASAFDAQEQVLIDMEGREIVVGELDAQQGISPQRVFELSTLPRILYNS